jgi:preprotein translocase subunit SecF
VLAGAAAVVCILGWFALRTRYDHNLLNLQAKGLESVRWEMKLIENTAGASLHALSCTRTREEALALKKQFEQLPEVSQVVEVASLVPLDQPRKLDLLRDIHHQLRWLPNRGAVIPHMAPDVETLRGDLDKFVDLVTTSDQVPDVLRLSARELGRKLGEASTASGSTVSPTLQRFDERLAGDLCESLHRLRDVSTPEQITVDDLPVGLRERHVGKNETWLLRVFTEASLWEFENLEHFTKQISTVDPEATGRPFGTVEGLRAMKTGLERAGLYALIAIVLLLWLDFRSLRETLLALLPLVAGVVCSLGVMGLFDLPLNPANMIAFPLILGVGVDNGVHLLHDWRVSRLRIADCGLRIEDTNRPHAISHAMGWGVLVKSLTTVVGFGALMVSTERGLVSLGFLLAMGVGWAMVTALIVLPAILEMMRHARAEDEPTLLLASSSPPPLLPSSPADSPSYGDGRGEGSRDRAAA